MSRKSWFVPPERIAELADAGGLRHVSLGALAEATAQHAEFAIGFDGDLDLRGLDRVHRPGPRHG